MNGLQEYLFVVKYEKNEFVTMPLQQEHLFQIKYFKSGFADGTACHAGAAYDFNL